MATWLNDITQSFENIEALRANDFQTILSHVLFLGESVVESRGFLEQMLRKDDTDPQEIELAEAVIGYGVQFIDRMEAWIYGATKIGDLGITPTITNS